MYRSTVPSDGPPPATTCESCGAAGETLVAVRRVYLEDDGAGGLRVASTATAVEWWCPACRAVYPNAPDPEDG